MTRVRIAALIGLVAATVLVLGAMFVPIELRHSAPFGFNVTFDRERGIAVRGGVVSPNYDSFNRVDLDLRAYQPNTTYDLTLHVRRSHARGADLRTIPFRLSSSEIWHNKAAFDNPFHTVRFPPIVNSAGRDYYVWVERGPGNRDDVLAVWSIKSYSSGTGRDALMAFLNNPPGDRAERVAQLAIWLAISAFVVTFAMLMASLVALALQNRDADIGGDIALTAPDRDAREMV